MQSQNQQNQPPPKKKRKRTSTENTEFIAIINKMSKEFNTRLLNCWQWRSSGVICTVCNGDSKLKGPFTDKDPIKNFNYNKLKKHIISTKHKKRLDRELMTLFPTDKAAQIIQVEQSENMPTSITTEFDKIVNSFKLIHMVIKLGLPLNKIIHSFN